MSFIFAPADAKAPHTARKVHVRRLYDILNLSIQRRDFVRATRAWTILAHCKEVDWRALWRTSVHILAGEFGDTSRSIEFLHIMMLQHPEDRETILREVVLRLIGVGQYREALDELELYLPSFPYQDNALLHLYSALLSLYLSQPPKGGSQSNPSLLRDAQSHFERAKILDPGNAIADAFLDKIQHPNRADVQSGDESDDEVANKDPKRKRLRT
ncbi:hypothetical protein B0H15DRAFT_128764 [Mycena belliarum]|uniref:Uncharacterized protein n=1 Tax=Mycena belliarum TaxID=1033014 RepID=A0AAD6XPW0_9AGAR|nr:hypothetical protein B0H15DRAFT_128764 [Mycena belliae]